jgi:ribonuclease HI
LAKRKKYYVVWAGHEPGVYDNWNDCLKQTKNFPAAKYKSFKSRDEAHDAFLDPFSKHIGLASKSSKVIKGQQDLSKFGNKIISNSISVDAACSGNPGIMEYRGVHTVSREEIFRQGPHKDGTNNIGEFLALVHALALLKKLNKNTPIYTDSRTAMAWVRNKKVKTTLTKNTKNQNLFEMMDRAIIWLKSNTYTNQIIKWDTKNWGEIPADFGRK